MHCPTLRELPPLQRKTGWPWTEESPQLPPTMPDGRPWPRITLVTPNYNYGHFLEETIRSVLLQGYPNLEYIVIDGGSTDESLDIIQRYSPWLSHWLSESDRGHVDAINKGLQRASGEWFNWLNSDDLLLKGSLETLATIASLVPEAQWISGATIFLSESGSPVDYYAPWRTDPTVMGFRWPNFPQDATFVRPSFMQRNGVELIPGVTIFDSLFHWQLIKYDFPVLTPACLSAMRLHRRQVHADKARRGEEIKKHMKSMRDRATPFWVRSWRWLLKTRGLSTVFRRFLALCIWYGLTPGSRQAKAVVYDRSNYSWKTIAGRKAMIA